ncbi:hypothetical protein PF005_g26314 [Phytophthora fragariae]|uniref:Uncharacterized protein n=1 Tax=Phytophthora fragariae TaxID=53985 RepID=A0A6A3EXJ2_9STRA|nr:hypothetical protein PF003_g12059 [Phytophthora fragariae]KAE8938082.1 hypothetical protein PF009_g12023 [Phytophthora fragariae]KAE9003834.1 hypothetical protein PF011_g12741 [Phytophthora fragariae]KAE9076081.1 hypothetical protein PF010_g24049 [Phytophthora fragariae]KAE9105150.1 hypothetical protein PF007_g13795 [Phytophthora fragariae]
MVSVQVSPREVAYVWALSGVEGSTQGRIPDLVEYDELEPNTVVNDTAVATPDQRRMVK